MAGGLRPPEPDFFFTGAGCPSASRVKKTMRCTGHATCAKSHATKNMSGRFHPDSPYGKAFAKACDEFRSTHGVSPESEDRKQIVRRTEEILAEQHRTVVGEPPVGLRIRVSEPTGIRWV